VAFEGDSSLGEEGRRNVLAGFADGFATAEDLGFWKAETEGNDEDRWGGAEPEELNK